MQIGDIIATKGADRLIGEIIAIDDWDRATVVTDSGDTILIHRCDFIVIRRCECNG